MSDVEQVLALADFDAAQHESSLKRAEAYGFKFFRLADVEDDPAVRCKLYTLVREGVLETPGHTGGFESFEEFSEKLFEPCYWRAAESQFLAADGEVWVGLSSLTVSGTEALFGLTAVPKPYRGRGVARALKVRALTHAASQGVKTVKTSNDSSNHAMLALNRSLGFRPIHRRNHERLYK